jgi:hypothetical protein
MDADDVNDNMYYIAQGSRIPFSQSVDGSLTSSDNTASLGDSTTTWNTLYCGDVFNDTLTTADRSLFYFIAGETLVDTATAITFSITSGLDNYESVMILNYLVLNTNASGNLSLIFNGDSAANYGRQYISGQSTAVAANRQQAQTSIIINLAFQDPTECSLGFTKAILYGKTGHERTIMNTINGALNNSTVYAVYSQSLIWNNSADTLTTLKFYCDTSMRTGTTIQLWGRK